MFNQDIAEQYGLTIYESDAPDREEIDFSVYDSGLDDSVAWVRGEKDDYEVKCNHKIEWGDDNERGYCAICGKECDWHYEKDEGDVENYHWNTQERIPDRWYEGDGGIIKQYIEQRRKHGSK